MPSDTDDKGLLPLDRILSELVRAEESSASLAADLAQLRQELERWCTKSPEGDRSQGEGAGAESSGDTESSQTTAAGNEAPAIGDTSAHRDDALDYHDDY